MTAEIAVLNKSAVALATDSAVTISSGDKALKIFESADKLFELSCKQPIGIMIYNGMQFLGVPFDTIIKSFRKKEEEYDTVESAANSFLIHLYDYLDGAPEEELYESIAGVIGPIAAKISKQIQDEVLERLVGESRPENVDDFGSAVDEVVSNVLDRFDKIVGNLGSAEFLPRSDSKKQAKRFSQLIRKAVETNVTDFAKPSLERIIAICTNVLKSNHISQNKTGLVFCRFWRN